MNKYFRYSNFLIANCARPFFAFSNNIELYIDELFKSDDSEDDFDSDNSKEKYNLLDFAIDEIENKIDKNFSAFLKESDKKSLDEKSTFEKISYLKNILENDADFYKKLAANQKIDEALEFLNSLKSFESTAMGLEIIEKKAIEFIKKLNQDRNFVVINVNDKYEARIKKTNEAITKNAIVFFPVFEYKKCLATPLYYDSKNKTIGILNYSSKSSLKNIIRFYFEVKVMRSQNISVNKCVHILPKFRHRKNVKANELDFISSEYCKATKSKSQNSAAVKKKNYSEEILQARFAGIPNPSEKKSENRLTIIEHINNDLSTVNRDSFFDIQKDDFVCTFKQFVYYAENFESISELNNLEKIITIKDTNDRLDLKLDFYRLLVKKIIPEYTFSSKIVLKRKINNLEQTSLADRDFLEFYENNKIAINPKILEHPEYLKLVENKAKIVWFDFEGVSKPTPIIDYNPAYNQLISQTSIIKTINNEIIEKETNDFVYDPLNYNYKTLVKIVNDLYDKNAEHYVVFNKSYEKSRLIEIKEMLENYCEDGSIDKLTYELQSQKINEVNSKMIDIADFFNGKTAASKYINLGFTKGLYSIKKIELFVSNSNLKLKHMITPYHELAVKNGGMALQIATARAFNAIKDREWEQKEIQLKKYCHNDVMAMIMTFDLIQYLLNCKKTQEYFKNFIEYKNI
ncbi:UU173 family protein [Metamycoplasma equirhinis]|uniref:UU173 family protein n=1 Tax=Metamycoplasma equirhinis TaxID=92402 RepID=UPI003593CF6C